MSSSEWKTMLFTEIADYTTGKLNSNQAESNGKYPFFTCSPEVLKINRFAFDQDAVLLAGNNANGIFHLKRYNGKFNAYQRTYVINSKDKDFVNNKFIYYQLSLKLNMLKEVSLGTATRFLTKTILDNIEFNVPPKDEMIFFADILSCLDDKRELNNRINNNLEEIAQAIFKSWFVDFEPFQEGEFEDSELGRIPKGWRVGTLGDILDNIKNQEKAGTHIKDIPYVPIDSIPMKCLGLSDFKPGEGAQSSLVRFLKNDVLIGAMRVYFHRVVLAPFDGITRTTCFVLRPKQSYLLSYALLLCNLDNTIEYAQKTSKGSTMPYAIWDGGLKDLKIIIPEEKTIEHFNEVVFPLLKQVRDGLFENITLNYIRDSLLPRLMSGEIKVPIEEVQ